MNSEVLSDVAKIIMGQSPPSSTYNSICNGLPFFQGKADFGEMYPTPRVYCSEPNRVSEPGDILITVRAPVGPTNINPVQSCIGRGLAAIRASKAVDRNYLLYFLRFYEPELAKAGTGSTFAAISREDLETVKIPLPPLTDQRRIANILSRADRLRRLRRGGDALTGSLLQSVFLEMFGDPVRNSKGWERAIIDDVLSLSQYGTSNKSNSDKRGYPVLGMTNITYDGKLELEPLSYVEISAKELRELRLEKGDIIFNRTNSTELVGKTTFWNHDFDAVIASYLVKLKLKKNVLPEYFVTFLNMPYYKHLFQERCKKAIGQSNISPTLLREFPMLIPPLPEQERFAAIVRRVESLRRKQAESARQAEELFQSLLAQSFKTA